MRIRHISFLLGISLIAQVSVNCHADETRFDCEDAFNAVSLVTTLACNHAPVAATTVEILPAALQLLTTGHYLAREALENVQISWCPLGPALGFVPSANKMIINATLADGSAELLAEVIAHESVHIQQFRTRGARRFKCDYVRAYLACGACQGREHALEAPAYELQDVVREDLMHRWREQPIDQAASAPSSAPYDHR